MDREFRPKTDAQKRSRAADRSKLRQTEAIGNAAHDAPYRRFIERTGETEIRDMLALERPARFKRALERILLHDQAANRRGSLGISTASILKQEGVSLMDMTECYGRWMMARAVQVAVSRAPQIMSDTADDASNKKTTCARCDGYGHIDNDRRKNKHQPTLRTCPDCNGEGFVTQSGDDASRRIVLEAAGIIGKKGPLVDARSVHLNAHGSVNVESLVKELETIQEMPMLEEPGIIDAEVIDAGIPGEETGG